MTENFADLFEQSTVSKQKIHYGMKVNAKIVGMDESSVFVDIGAKTDGYVEKAELIDTDGNFNYKIGDYLELYIVTNKESELKLSRALSGDGSYNVIKDAFERKITVSGKVKSVNKGGFDVTVMGKRAFCPISQMDVKKIENAEQYVGSVFNFKVSDFEEEKKNIVLSRRPILEAEQKEAIDKLIANLKEVDVISGKVTKVSEIGAFIDLGSRLEGMIHVSELAWTRVAHASEVVKPGDIVTAKVLKVEHAEGKRYPRISLSLKQLSLHPWESVAARVKQGDIINGRVTRCADFGAFVELFPGVEGLVHISEITGEKRIKKVNEIINPGDMVEAIVLGVDLEQKRISLSIKELQKKNDPAPEAAAEPETGNKSENNRLRAAAGKNRSDEDNWRNYTKIEDAPDADDEEDENPFKALKNKLNS